MLGAFSAAALSGILMAASFPSYNLAPLAWFGLVPLLLYLSRRGPTAGFCAAFIFGVVFYTGVFYWMFDLPKYSLLHHAVLGVYLCPLMGLWGSLFCIIAKRRGLATALLSAAFIWAALEYLRANLSFIALPWGLLGHSQYQYPMLIQSANIAGVYGLSFLIVLVNSAFTAVLHFIVFDRKKNDSTAAAAFLRTGKSAVVGIGAAAFLANAAYGYMLTFKPIKGNGIGIAVVQANIEQSKKWDPAFADAIVQTYADLTRRAAEENPSLIVWPETATPRSIIEHYNLYRRIQQIATEAKVPILLGSTERPKHGSAAPLKKNFMNSAFLIQSGSIKEKLQRYDKIILLPFSEYLPYKEIIPWSYLKIPETGSFIPGENLFVFRLSSVKFGVTICWENIFADFVRRFVNNGAQFIINITNEAWFGKTAAAYQFLSMSVFRAVENGVFVVRCANTGISCFIDPCGRILDRVKDKSGEDVFVRGVSSKFVIPLNPKTFYTRYGDYFAWLCIILSVSLGLLAVLKI